MRYRSYFAALAHSFFLPMFFVSPLNPGFDKVLPQAQNTASSWMGKIWSVANTAKSIGYSLVRSDESMLVHQVALNNFLKEASFHDLLAYLYNEGSISQEDAVIWCVQHQEECYVPLWYFLLRHTARYSVSTESAALEVWEYWLKCRIQATLDVACCNKVVWHRSILTILDKKYHEYVAPLKTSPCLLKVKDLQRGFHEALSFFETKLDVESGKFTSEGVKNEQNEFVSEFPHPAWVWFCQEQSGYGLPALNFPTGSLDYASVAELFSDNQSSGPKQCQEYYFLQRRRRAFEEVCADLAKEFSLNLPQHSTPVPMLM